MKVGMREIAVECGVTIATVSLALNDRPGVSESTRRRVNEVAERLGYRRVAARTGLGRGRIATEGTRVGWIEQPDGELRHTETFARGLGRELRAKGYRLKRYSSKAVEGDIDGFLRGENLAALILHRFSATHPFCQEDWTEHVVIGFERHDRPLPYPVMRINIAAAAREMVSRVWEYGYRRLGMVTAGARSESIVQRECLEGWTSEYYVRSGRWPEVSPFQGAEVDPAALKRWIRRERPDGVLAISPAIGIILAQCECVIPEAIGFACLDARRGEPWAGIQLRTASNARVLAANIDYHYRHGLHGIRRSPSESLLGFEWIAGKTLRMLK